MDTDDGYSLSSRTSIFSKTRKFDRRPSTPRKDVLADVDDIAKMKVTQLVSTLMIFRGW